MCAQRQFDKSGVHCLSHMPSRAHNTWVHMHAHTIPANIHVGSHKHINTCNTQYLHMYIHVSTNIHAHRQGTCEHTRIHTCIHTYTCMYEYNTHICIHLYIHVQKYIHIHTCMFIYTTHTHTILSGHTPVTSQHSIACRQA